jgi:hypothetical protein
MNSNDLKKQVNELQTDLKKLNKQLKTERKTQNDVNVECMVKLREQKVKDLEVVTKQLKRVKQREQQASSIHQKIDSMEFSAAKQSRNDNALSKARQGKIKREELRKKYELYTEYENKYNRVDPPNYPGYIFLHEKVTQMYGGVCPYVYVNPQDFDKSDITESLSTLRSDWLKQQSDSGTVYNEMKSILIDKSKWLVLERSIKMLEASIDKQFHENLSERHTKMYENCVMFFEEFSTIKVKSKNVREQYNKIINLLSQLCSETNIPFNVYLASKYNINILVNSFHNNENDDHNLIESEHIQNKLNALLQYEQILNEYVTKLSEFEQHKKFVHNTNTYLQNELYNYISKITENNFTERQQDNKFEEKNGTKKETCQQSGKYFRRWAVLSKEERDERFYSFAEFFVKQIDNDNYNDNYNYNDNDNDNDNYNDNDNDNDNDKCTLVDDLYNMLKNNYETKAMVYRDFVWNTNKGIIEKVKKLTFDKNSRQFNINFSKKGKSAASERSLKKKTELEQKINDELLYFLVKTKGLGTLESFISNIQKHVNVTKNEKNIIETHYSTFKDVVLKKLEELRE